VIDMLRVIWDDSKYVTFFGDSELTFAVEGMIRTYNEEPDTCNRLRIAQMTMILAFQLAVKQKKISYKDIVFVYNEEEIKIDQNGNLEKWPFPDVITDMLLELA
jgi:hypothetical protein